MIVDIINRRHQSSPILLQSLQAKTIVFAVKTQLYLRVICTCIASFFIAITVVNFFYSILVNQILIHLFFHMCFCSVSSVLIYFLNFFLLLDSVFFFIHLVFILFVIVNCIFTNNAKCFVCFKPTIFFI